MSELSELSERDRLIQNRTAYMMIGDIDKPFHLPECECDACEGWRRFKGRPTHAELRAMPSAPHAPAPAGREAGRE